MNTSASTYSPPVCLRTELRKEFVRRCKSNSAYSLRAFAKFLSVDQSLLSKVMSGQRSISESVGEKIASKLKIRPSRLLQSYEANLTYHQLIDDEVSLLADWSHFAILELAKTKNFKLDYKWMADRLSLHTKEVEDALERLVRMGFVAIENKSLILLKPNNCWTQNVSTTVARQELQRTLLKKASDAISAVEFSQREHTSLTVAVRKDRMFEFKEKLLQVRNELDAFFQPAEDEASFDDVYQLTISFFPITKDNKQENSK